MTTPSKAAKATEKPADAPDAPTLADTTADPAPGAVDDMAMVDETPNQLAELASNVDNVASDVEDAQRRLDGVEARELATVEVLAAQAELLDHLATLLPTADTRGLVEKARRALAALADHGHDGHPHIAALRAEHAAHDAQMEAEAEARRAAAANQ